MKTPTTPRPITPAEERVIRAAVDLYAALDAINHAWTTDEYILAKNRVESGKSRLTRAVRALERERAKKGKS